MSDPMAALKQLKNPDHLKVSKNNTFLSTLEKTNKMATSEKVLWSDTVEKRNKRGVYQKRDLVITSGGVYSFKKGNYKDLKRRIALSSLEKIVLQTTTKECLFKVYDEYDYWYKIANILELLHILTGKYKELVGIPLPIQAVSKSLSLFVRTKRDMQLSRKASDRKEMMQIRTNESKTRLAAMKGPSGPAIEGWLAKCGFNSAKYLPRYFQLVNNILLYHATRLKGSIKLERASMTSISYDEKSQMFKFTLNTGRKKLTLGDPHKKNCQKWISKISLAIKEMTSRLASPIASPVHQRNFTMQDHRLRRLRITRTHQGLSLRADSPGPPGLKRRVVGFARRRPGTPDARGSRSFFSSKRRYSVGEFQQWVSAKYNACRSAMDLKAAADRPRVGNNDADEASPVSTPPNTPRNALSSDHQFPSSPPPSPETKRRKSPGPSPPRESRKKQPEKIKKSRLANKRAQSVPSVVMSTIVAQGFLLKEDTRTKNMRRRLFTLHDNTLSYFETDLKGNIPLSNDTAVTATVTTPALGKRMPGFGFVQTGFKYHFTVGKADRLYKMAADSSKDLQKWIQYLETTIATCKDLPKAKLLTEDLKEYMIQEAPTGELTLVFTDVQSSTKLWENRKAEMEEGIQIHDGILRGLLKKHNGYEVRTEGDAFFVAFFNCVDALGWCFDSQFELLKAAWPEHLMTYKAALKEPPFWAGVRVRMGLHIGRPICKKNPVHGRMEYFGPIVNEADRMADSGHGGQIICTQSVRLALEAAQKEGKLEGLSTEWLGKYPYEGVKDLIDVFQVTHPKLAGRGVTAPGKFPELRIDWGLPNASLATNYPRSQKSRVGSTVSPIVSPMASTPSSRAGSVARVSDAALPKQSGPASPAATDAKRADASQEAQPLPPPLPDAVLDGGGDVSSDGTTDGDDDNPAQRPENA